MSRRPNGPPHEDGALLEEKKRIEGFKMRVLDHEPEVISHEAISAVCQRHSGNSCLEESEHPVLVESLGSNTSAIPDQFADPGQGMLPGM